MPQSLERPHYLTVFHTSEKTGLRRHTLLRQQFSKELIRKWYLIRFSTRHSAKQCLMNTTVFPRDRKAQEKQTRRRESTLKISNFQPASAFDTRSFITFLSYLK